jgi:hypothetical protein
MNDRLNRNAAGGRPRAARGTLLVAAVAVAVAAILLAGCGPSQPAAAPPPAPPPDSGTAAPAEPRPATRLRVASLDVSKFSGRVEQAHVDELASIIAGLKVEVLALQGITRYPTVKTRIDLVHALAAAAGMRALFGETLNLSGRQSGNAVLSAYPVASSDTKGFEGVSGLNFEGALRVIVDAGTRPVVVVSTLLPSPLSAKDSMICLDVIAEMTSERGSDPLVVLGNLPPSPGGGWKEIAAGGTGGRLWYTPGPIGAGGGSAATCAFGTILVTDIDIYPQTSR